MDVFKKNEEAFNRSNQILYNNNQPVQERKKRRTVLLDIDDSGLYAKPGNWEALLYEPLIINNNSDVYLDTLITYSAKKSNTDDVSDTSSGGEDAGFLLGINELNIDSLAGTEKDAGKIKRPNTNNKILIPNNSGSSADGPFGGGDKKSIIHKSNKMNYICQINPIKITKFTGTFTNLEGSTAFAGDTSRLIMELVIVERD